MEAFRNSLSASRTNAINWFERQPTLNKVCLICAFSLHVSIAIFTLIYYQRIIEYIVAGSDHIREMGYRGVLIFVLSLSIVSFPPLIGFSSLCIIIGIVYGFQGFWMIAITSSVMSTVSLCVFKYYFRNASQRIIDNHDNLKLFVTAIKDSNTTFVQEIIILTLMKLSPLPYSLTNGGLGCVPHLSPLAFFLACVICSPKYFGQLFMGIQLRKIGSIDKNSNHKVVDIILILVTAISFGALSMLLYRKLQAKMRERESTMPVTATPGDVAPVSVHPLDLGTV